MRLKKILYILVAVTTFVLGALYAGFFSSNQEKTTEEEERQVIRVLAPYQGNMQQQILNKVAAEYSRDESKPEIKIIYVPKENLKKELSVRRMTGESQVDLVICENTMVQEMIGQELLKDVPVSREMKEDVVDDRFWQALQHDGKYYGYPLTSNPYVLYYNADMLEERNVDVPTSWSELIQAGYRVKKSGIQSIGIAGKRETELTNLYWIMMYSSGGNLNTVSEELWEKCFQNFRQLSLGGLTSGYATNFTQEDLAQEFAEGRVTMMINQMSVTSILKSNQTKFTVGMAEVPYDEAGGTFWFGDEVCITKEAGNGALSFAQYLTKEESSERINDAMGTLQVYSGVSYKKNGKIYMEDTSILSAKARPMLYYQSWSDICGTIANGVSTVLNSNLSDVLQVAEATKDQVRVSIMSEP